MLKPRKNTDFFFLVIYLKETEPGLKSVACKSWYYLGKDGNIGKEVLGMGTYFAPSSLFMQASRIIHRGKICVQGHPLERYLNVKTSIFERKY